MHSTLHKIKCPYFMDIKSLCAEKKIMDSQTVHTRDYPYKIREELVFFSDLKDFSLQATNLRSRYFLGEALLSSADLSYLDLVHPEDRQQLKEHLEACRKTASDNFLETELRLRNSSGEWV